MLQTLFVCLPPAFIHKGLLPFYKADCFSFIFHYFYDPQAGLRANRGTQFLYPMARTCALLTKTKVFPDGVKNDKSL
jgi:hypothetical protein